MRGRSLVRGVSVSMAPSVPPPVADAKPYFQIVEEGADEYDD